MKLLELLVKERIEWHPEALCYTQDGDDMRVYPSKTEKPRLDGEMWCSAGALSKYINMPERADDWQTAIVTKEQYDNACKLVDDGYTLWFGGECPVQGDAMLDMVWIHNGAAGDLKPVKASDFPWNQPADVIAYKVVKPVLISTHKHDASLEQFYAQGWTDEQLIEHGYAKVAEPGDEELSVVYKPVDLLSLHVPDVVNHPSHYTNGKVECIDAIESATVGKTGIEAVCVANVIKYLWRYEDKNGLEDIKKAQWYLNKLIEVKK